MKYNNERLTPPRNESRQTKVVLLIEEQIMLKQIVCNCFQTLIHIFEIKSNQKMKVKTYNNLDIDISNLQTWLELAIYKLILLR